VDEFGTTGPYLGSWATGTEWPAGIGVDDDGFLYVAAGAPAYTIDKVFSGGAPVTSWGGLGDGDGLFRGLLGLTAGAHGPIVATDYVRNEVQAFAGDGTFLYRFGGTGTEPGQFLQPIGVAIDHTGAIYVVDSGNQRVQKFSAAATPARASSWGRIKRLYR
jgi:DNA-binding beta-propeller fold protein YncE